MAPRVGPIIFCKGAACHFLGVTNLLFGLLTVPENILLAVVIRNIAKRRQWRIPDILIVSIALTDFLTGLICQPIHGYFVLRQRNIYNAKDVNTGDAWAFLIMNFFSYFLCGASLLLVALMSVDRFRAIAKPMKYRETSSKTRIIVIIALIFAISFIIPLFRIVSRKTAGIFMLLLIIVVVTALSTTLISYSLLLYVYKKHRALVVRDLSVHGAETERQNQHYIRQQKRLTKSFVIIGVLLILMYLPQLILKPISLAIYSADGYYSDTLILLEDIANTILYSNSLLNPLIYSYNQKEIRLEVKRILCCRLNNIISANGHTTALPKRDQSLKHQRNPLHAIPEKKLVTESTEGKQEFENGGETLSKPQSDSSQSHDELVYAGSISNLKNLCN